MTLDQTTERNIRFAKFMGSTIEQWYPENEALKQSGLHAEFPVGDPWPEGKRYWEVTHLKYHKDWNWIMMLVQKIGDGETADSKLGMAVNIILPRMSCEICDNTQDYCYIEEGGDTLIEAVCNSIDKFIKWYENR